jgi:2-oxoglutarate dehydrogenase E2 component (dihydrolipoamide succinyltransferase)
MSIEIKVPPLPESVSDATLVAWHKTVGEGVARDENLVDLETDKVVLEVPAPASGTLAKIVVEDGATVVAGDVLAILEEGEVTATSEAEPAQENAKTSPAVRRLLDEHDLDATMVTGTGKDGRLTKGDVMAFLKSDSSSEVTPGDPRGRPAARRKTCAHDASACPHRRTPGRSATDSCDVDDLQ